MKCIEIEPFFPTYVTRFLILAYPALQLHFLNVIQFSPGMLLDAFEAKMTVCTIFRNMLLISVSNDHAVQT